MSLNCPTCGLVIQRAESHKDCVPKKLGFKKAHILQVERSLSMNMARPPRPPDRQEGRGEPMSKIKREHRRIQSVGAEAYPGNDEPRLVRSSGMRRDWSFEELPDKNEESHVPLT